MHYNNITDFKEFISNATEEQIDKAIDFLNIVGFYQGISCRCCCDDLEIVIKSIEYAKSNYTDVKYFLKEKLNAEEDCFRFNYC